MRREYPATLGFVMKPLWGRDENSATSKAPAEPSTSFSPSYAVGGNAHWCVTTYVEFLQKSSPHFSGNYRLPKPAWELDTETIEQYLLRRLWFGNAPQPDFF